MCNVLLIGPYFANSKHGAEVGVYDALVELGHNVTVWDPREKMYFNERVGKIPIGQVSHIPADLVLCLGPGAHSDVLASDLWRNLECPKVLWSSEPIRLPQYRDKILIQKGQFGHYFTFDESEIPLYHDLGIWSIDFLPQAFNPKWYKPLGYSPIGDLCFVGSIGGEKWGNRTYFINRVKKFSEKMGLIFNVYSGIFDAEIVNQIYNAHKLVLNLGLYLGGPIEQLKSSGLQQRIFEAIGSGKVVVTNEIPAETNKLFEHGKHLLYYNAGNLEEILRQSLLPEVQTTIKQNVLSIREQHTYTARIKQMFSILGV